AAPAAAPRRDRSGRRPALRARAAAAPGALAPSDPAARGRPRPENTSRTCGTCAHPPGDYGAGGMLDPPPDGCARLDAATIADLDLPLVFREIDRTVTPTGNQALWRWVISPALDPAVLDERERRLGELADPAQRERIAKVLAAGTTSSDAPF